MREQMRDRLEDDVTPADTSHTTFLPVREAPAMPGEQGKQDGTIYTAKSVQQHLTRVAVPQAGAALPPRG